MSYGSVLCPMALSCVLWPCPVSYGPVLCPMSYDSPLVGGICAVVGAIAVGPRKGRFDIGEEDSFAAHSLPFQVLGTFCLWFGWYGFNPGLWG